MSDNPRPQLYQARYTALLANRADEQSDGLFTIAGKHCESGDVLIEGVELPEPRRGDLIAGSRDRRLHARHGLELQRRPAPAAGARRRPARPSDRRRETVDDLLEREL
jgi:diaminopimelate decarboxylase